MRSVKLPEILLQALILFGLLVVLFPRVFFFGEVAVPGSLLYEMDPWKEYAPPEYTPVRNNTTLESLTGFALFFRFTHDSFRDGEWPLWNHLQYMGLPFLANYQSSIFYPPHILQSFLDAPICMTVYILLKLWLCGMAAYVCARVMKFTPGLSRFLSVAWMLSAFNVIWSYWPLPDVTGWLPIFFLGTEFLLDYHYRRGFFTSAFAACLLMLAGHPESAFAMCLMCGVYFIMRLLLAGRTGRDLWVPLAIAAAVWVLVCLICAVQLVPFFENLVNSYTFAKRGEAHAVDYFMPIGALVSLWVPRFYGATPDGNFQSYLNSTFVSTIYPGIAVWIGSTLLLVRGHRSSEQRHRNLCLSILAVLSIGLAVNAPGVSMVSRLPLFSSMRGLYHSVFAMWALPLLAASGLSHWFSQKRKARELFRVLPVPIAVAIGIYALYAFHRPLLVMEGRNPYVLALTKYAV